MDIPNIPIAPAAKSIPTKSLTDFEKSELAVKGFDLSKDFVDIPVQQATSPVPAIAAKQEREQAISRINEVLSSHAYVEPPKPAEDVELLHAEIDALKAKLAEATNKESIPDNCPHCLWDLKTPVELSPSIDEIEEFLFCVVSGSRYVKTYRIFGGAVLVKFSTRTSLEDRSVQETIGLRIRNGDFKAEAQIFNAIERMNFLTSLTSLNMSRPGTANTLDFPVVHDALKIDAKLLTTVDKYLDNRVQDIPTQLLGALLEQYRNFAMLVGILMSRANDENFWKGSPDSTG